MLLSKDCLQHFSRVSAPQCGNNCTLGKCIGRRIWGFNRGPFVFNHKALLSYLWLLENNLWLTEFDFCYFNSFWCNEVFPTLEKKGFACLFVCFPLANFRTIAFSKTGFGTPKVLKSPYFGQMLWSQSDCKRMIYTN